MDAASSGDWVTQARTVGGLLIELGQAFEREFKDRGDLSQLPLHGWHDFQSRYLVLRQSVIELKGFVERPPPGLKVVADKLCDAGRLCQQIEKKVASNAFD